MPPCELGVSRFKTKDGRTVCGLPGKIYSISGGVGQLVVTCCKWHFRKLENVFDVRELTPLEANVLLKKIAQRPSAFVRQHDGGSIEGDRCTCSRDPFTCPVNDHAVEARRRDIEG
jgi:hypothetical protein